MSDIQSISAHLETEQYDPEILGEPYLAVKLTYKGKGYQGHLEPEGDTSVSETPQDNNWWRHYPLTEEQRERHQKQWDDHHWNMVLGMERLMQTQGGGFGGGGGSWDSPCGDPRPFPMDIRFFVPPLEHGYFSEAGKQHMLKDLDRFCADIRRMIEDC